MRLPTLAAHGAQTIIAFTVLGLAAYGVDYISYNVLIYSLAVVSSNTSADAASADYEQTVCSVCVSLWMIASRTLLAKFDNVYVALGLHALMLVFWIVDLGLVAALAHEWNPQCSYSAGRGKICSSFAKRDTTFRTYLGALVAGAVLAGLEV